MLAERQDATCREAGRMAALGDRLRIIRLNMLGTAARCLPLALVATSLMIGTVPAKAEREGGLFDMLFGGGVRYKPRPEFPEAPRPRKVVAAPRVTGPSYYDYKA